MLSFLNKLITRLFYLLFFLTPLIFWPFSSELFEFNKIVFIYISTVLILTAWLIKCVLARKFIFRHTILDIPLLAFLSSLAISTFFSIDVRTSLLGYYSRFHGGFISYLSYSFLYWGYVSNFDREKTKKSVLILAISLIPVLIYGILQHFGVDKNIWVQDVQNRIFSTLGQPNWLAAWLVALAPLTWAFSLKEKGGDKQKSWFWLGLSALTLTGLLFTKSRSGILGFATADLIFWLAGFWVMKRKALSSFILHHLMFLVLVLTIGTPFTSSVPAPEAGGTESGEIRKIVWKGAVDLWKKYPLLGTGPETFAYSYYETRPVEHNLVSEWNFIYNKAHNEYLNFLATTGILGLTAYLFLIGAILFQLFPKNKGGGSFPDWNWVLLAGFVSILLTNFFGFSVTPIALLFFMFPAFVVSLKVEGSSKFMEGTSLSAPQKISLLFLLGTMFYFLYRIGIYWYSDALYAKGRLSNASENFLAGREFLVRAVGLSPMEPVFWDELSKSSTGTAVLLNEEGEEKSSELATLAISESNHAISLSPRNVNLQRTQVSIFERLAVIEPTYLLAKKKALEDLIPLAPTDASLYYALALTEERIGEREFALNNLSLAIEMKSNYKNARFAKALILISAKRNKEAKEELVYILEKIDPNDNLVRQELEKIN